MSSFIHFGCWNYKTCPGNDFEQILYNINMLCKQKDYVFLSVAGDNYYPQKNAKKQKFIWLQDLLAGFKCLKNININKKYILLGNHDVTPDKIINDNIEDTNCTILENEINAADPYNIITKEHVLLSHTLVIFIDTSFYEDKSDKYMNCYSKIASYTNKQLNELMELQYNYVINQITNMKSNIKNIIIIGHHPLTCIKNKKNTDILLKYNNHHSKFIKLLYDAFSIHKDKSNYYLCADLHLYQKNEIVINNNNNNNNVAFTQYIVGIGGTKLDELPKINNTIIDHELAVDDYKIFLKTYPSVKKHGFLEVTEINDGMLTFMPHFIINGGQTNKRRKNIMKKKNTKRKTLKKKKH